MSSRDNQRRSSFEAQPESLNDQSRERSAAQPSQARSNPSRVQPDPSAFSTAITAATAALLESLGTDDNSVDLEGLDIDQSRSQTHRSHAESHQQSEDQSEFSANNSSFPGGGSKQSTSQAEEGVEEQDDIEAEDGVAVNNPFHFTEEDILSFIDQPLRTRRELQEAFQQAKTKGNMPLIHFTYDQEIACTTLRDVDRDFTVKEMYMVYLFLHEKIVDGLIDGTLPRSLNDQSSEEYRIHQMLLQRAISARNPAYYMATITSRSGEAPTFRDMEKALYMFDQYCDGNMSAILQIDSKRGVAADKSKTGFRFFFADANDRFVTRRLQVCKTFSRNLRPQLNFRDYIEKTKMV